MGRLNKFSICDLLIVLLITGVLLSNYIWIKLDQYPVEGHESIGLIPSVQVYRELIGKENIYKAYDKTLGSYNFILFYPPLSFIILSLFYILFGPQGQMVMMVNSVYIILALASLYFIGKNIANKPTGLLAAFILSVFPAFINFSRVMYWVEFGLVGYVALDLYLLLKTDFFENRKYSVLLGISLALSFLHKYEFIVFMIGPLSIILYKSGILKDIMRLRWSKRIINLALTVLLALGITSFWWGQYGKKMLARIFTASLLNREYDGTGRFDNVSYMKEVLSSKALTYYLRSLIHLVGFLFVILLCFAAVLTLIKLVKKNKKIFFLILFWSALVFPVAIFTFLTKKNLAHILAILPSVAILISLGIHSLKNKVFRMAIIILIVVFGFYGHIYPFYPIEINYKFFFPPRILYAPFIGYFINRTLHFAPLHPRRERIEFTITEILKYIKNDSIGKEQQRCLVIFKRFELKGCVFEYYNLSGDYGFIFSSSYWLASAPNECNYIIIEKPEGNEVRDILFMAANSEPDNIEKKNFKVVFKGGLKDYELIKIFNIPNDTSTMLIYRRKSEVIS